MLRRSVPILLKNKFKVSKLRLKNTNVLKSHFKSSWKKATKKGKQGKTVQKYANNSSALEELINTQRSYNDRTGLAYKEEEEGPSTTKYNGPMRFDMNVDFIGHDS